MSILHCNVIVIEKLEQNTRKLVKTVESLQKNTLHYNPDTKQLAVRWWQPPVYHRRFVRWFSVGPPVATARGFF